MVMAVAPADGAGAWGAGGSIGPPRAARPLETLRSLVQRPITVRPETTCAEVYAHFQRDAEATSVVVRLGLTSPGLVVKHRFMVTMSGHYGWALYHRKPVEHLADLNPGIMTPDTGLAQAAAAMLDRKPEHRYDDVIVQERNGALLGTLPVAVLLDRLGHLYSDRAAAALDALDGERRAAEALRTSEAFRRTILSTAPLVLFHVDLWGTITMAEGHGLTLLGLPPAAITGRSIDEAAAHLPELLRGYAKARGGKRVTFEARVGDRWFDAVWSPLRNDVGIVSGVVCVATDVTERRQVQTQLRTALGQQHASADRLRAALHREQVVAEHLRQLDELKTTFLQAVSHDLRTPLASVLGISLTLRHRIGEIGEEDRADLLERLAGNARKLDRLVADLLDLDRLAQGRVEPRWAEIDLGELARQTVAASAELLDGRRVEVDAAPVRLVADGAKVERILENLLTNAARHTAPGTPVWVTVRPATDRGGGLLTVADAGPGVPAELRERIFEPFDRGEVGPERANDGGSGIGLALVARFAELHSGRAWVGDRPGGGAAFSVHLPADPRVHQAAAEPGPPPAEPPPLPREGSQ
jgi:PAS domain S-box-containing protein